MKLLYAEFLWALLALAIPIIIHLFNFRKFQKVYFSDVSLLKEVKLEHKKKSRLKHYVVLALRMLFITATVIAFCYPYIPQSEKIDINGKYLSIYIDNSHSMDTKGVKGYHLERAKVIAEEIVKNAQPTDQIQIITNDFEGRHQRFYGQQDALNLIDEITVSYVSKSISNVHTRQLDLASSLQENLQMYWLSDFQKSMADLENIEKDTTGSVTLIPFENLEKNNFYIDSIWFNSPIRQTNKEDVIYAKVVNQSEENISFKATLEINGSNQGFTNYTLDANNSMEIEIPYTIKTNGLQQGKIELSDYPNMEATFDDTFYFSYWVAPYIKVLNLYQGAIKNDSSGYLGTLFGKNTAYSFRNVLVNQLNSDELNAQDLVILSNLDNISDGLASELKNYVSNGGNLCIFPSMSANLGSYNNLLSTISSVQLMPAITADSKTITIEADHPLYEGIFEEIPSNVDLPVVNMYFPITAAVSSGAVSLMKYQNGKSFFTYVPLSRGSITLFSVPIDAETSNLPKHALFVPTMLRIAEFSLRNNDYYYTIGMDGAVPLKNSELASSEIKVLKGESSFIPDVKKEKLETFLLFYDQIKEAGNYKVLSGDDLLDGVSYNYSRKESVQEYLSLEELKKLADEYIVSYDLIEGVNSEKEINLTDEIKDQTYWWTFIILALSFLFAEILVLRLWKDSI